MTAITLTLPYPISANRYWASRAFGNRAITYVTKEAKDYKAEVARIARIAGLAQPFDNRVHLDIKLYPHRPQDWLKRMQKLGPWWDNSVQCIDLGNANKILDDALQGVIYTDDKWIWKGGKERMEPDEHGARVVVTITPLMQPDHQITLPMHAPDLAAGVAVHQAMKVPF